MVGGCFSKSGVSMTDNYKKIQATLFEKCISENWTGSTVRRLSKSLGVSKITSSVLLNLPVGSKREFFDKLYDFLTNPETRDHPIQTEIIFLIIDAIRQDPEVLDAIQELIFFADITRDHHHE